MATAKARPYAQAIMPHIRTAAQLESWMSFLDALDSLWREHYDVVKSWSRTSKKSIEEKQHFLATHFAKRHPVKERFLHILLRDSLWDSLTVLKAQLQLLYDEQHGQGALELFASEPIDPQELEVIKKRFESNFPGKKFYIVHRPLSESGILARYQDKVLDLRASSRLKQMRKLLLKG